MQKGNEVKEHIVEYLREHPQVDNSLEEIATWWVERQELREPMSIIMAALEQLRGAGVVAERQTPGGRSVYYLSESRD